jgi:hypothetical protein
MDIFTEALVFISSKFDLINLAISGEVVVTDVTLHTDDKYSTVSPILQKNALDKLSSP